MSFKMQLHTFLRLLALLAFTPFSTIAAPLAIDDFDQSPAIGHQLFPRGLECTCCRPAETIVLTSTKLSVVKTTETVFTTRTQTKPVNIRATTTVTPVFTAYNAITETTTVSASGPCVSTAGNLIQAGDFETVPQSPPWYSYDFGQGNSVYYPYNYGHGGSVGHIILGCVNSGTNDGCHSGFYQPLDLCEGALYTFTVYHVFNKGPGGDGTCLFRAHINGATILTAVPKPWTTTNNPGYHPTGDLPWTRLTASFKVPGLGAGQQYKLYLQIECEGDRLDKKDTLYLDDVSFERNDEAIITEYITSTETYPPTATQWETITPSSVETAYEFIGGTKYWKRDDNELVRRGPTITLSECPCVNVECMTAVATTSKYTMTSYSTVFVTKPAETGVIIHTTSTLWVTVTAKTTRTTQAPSTVLKTVSATTAPIPDYSTTTIYTTFTEGLEEVTRTKTAGTITVTFSQAAYFPTGVVVYSPYTDGYAPWDSQSSAEYHLKQCAQMCFDSPVCVDFGVYAASSGETLSSNPDRYCLWYNHMWRLNERDQGEWSFESDTDGMAYGEAAGWVRINYIPEPPPDDK